ncbi:MAG: GNAT family N-acetyltransferase [Acidimicrobiia bacterium]|nr:GNAT family N-acetyltransferase [Acidimicrobiia bacterium]
MDEAPPTSVRPAREAEIPALRSVEVDAGRRFVDVGMAYVAGDEAPPLEWFRERLAAGRLWVAPGPTGEVVGYAAASEVDGEGHLDQVSVLASYSGRGIGRALVSAVADWARACGHDAVTLTTYRDVRWNGPWYRTLGFVDLDEEELGPELAAIRLAEAARGLDRHPRTAMRQVLA